MSDKKMDDMTFDEYIKEEKVTNNPTIINIEIEILAKLRREGFTDEQIYALPAVRVLKLYREVFLIEVQKDLSTLDKALEQNPALEHNIKVKEAFEQLKLAAKLLVKDDQQE